MSRMTQKDFEELAGAVENMRESLRGMVAGLVADGFTDEQSRRIVVSILSQQSDSGQA